MSRIRVLHIVEDLKIGGLERVIASIVLGLDKDRFTTDVWCLSGGGPVADDLAAKGIPLKILGMSSYRNPLSIVRLARLIRETDVHILHCHGYFASTFSRLASLISTVPVSVSHVHSTYYGYGKRHLRMERFLSRFTDCIICISNAVQAFVVETEGIQKDKTCVIYNGVDEAYAASIPMDLHGERTRMGIRDGETVVLTVASLTPVKGHRILLEAFQRAQESGFNGRLLIVGEGPLRFELQQTADRLGVSSRVIFAGERFDVTGMLRISDLFVLPSVEREGLGISLIEAMASGLPVIGSRLGGITEVIDDQVNGILVSPGSAGELADAIVRLAGDEAMREKMGRMGRKRYEKKFTRAEMLSRMEVLYDSLLKRKAYAP